VRLALFLLLTAGIAAPAAELTGKWAGTLEQIKGGHAVATTEEHHLTIRDDKGTIAGTAGPKRETQWAIQNARLAGSKLTFDVALPRPGWTMSYDLQIAGDEIAGTVQTKGGPEIQGKVRFKRDK
jgi:hypothetical protein